MGTFLYLVVFSIIRRMNRILRGGAIFAAVIFTENTRKERQAELLCGVEKTAQKFRNFTEAEKADHEFYKKLTGNERLQILVDLLSHGSEQRLERVSRITKLPRN
jgi:hypothetical protein